MFFFFKSTLNFNISCAKKSNIRNHLKKSNVRYFFLSQTLIANPQFQKLSCNQRFLFLIFLCFWLLLLYQVIQKNQNLTNKTADPPSAAILAIYLDQAHALPVRLLPPNTFYSKFWICQCFFILCLCFRWEKATRTPVLWCRFLFRMQLKRARYEELCLNFLVHYPSCDV